MFHLNPTAVLVGDTTATAATRSGPQPSAGTSRLSGITTAALVLLVSRLQQERVEQLQELHHQASSALRDKDINSERQEVDAVHEEVAEEQGEAKSGKSRPSNHSSAK